MESACGGIVATDKMSTKSLYSNLRQPEYTGENRCIPCTVLNVLIAGVVSGLVGVASLSLAVAVFTFSVVVIYFRGYLVPGTPTLTRGYFPDRVLRVFDKETTGFDVRIESNADEVDVERVLQDVAALEDCEERNDLCLTPGFRAMWYTQMDGLDVDDAKPTVGAILGIGADRVSVLPRSRSFEVKVDGETAGSWESREAFVTDMATERVLGERVEDWTDLSVEGRTAVANGLRVYLDRCPRCHGPVRLSEETVGSCCRSREVLASRCQDCGVRLFEIEATEVEKSGT